jgi:hypothetical protein
MGFHFAADDTRIACEDDALWRARFPHRTGTKSFSPEQDRVRTDARDLGFKSCRAGLRGVPLVRLGAEWEFPFEKALRLGLQPR